VKAAAVLGLFAWLGTAQTPPSLTRGVADRLYTHVVSGLVAGSSVSTATAAWNCSQINAALLQATATGSGTVALPAGTYRISGTISVPSGVRLSAYGATLIAIGGNARPLLANAGWTGNPATSTSNSDVTVEGGTWDNDCLLKSGGNNPKTGAWYGASGANYPGWLAVFDNTTRLRIRDATFQWSAKYLICLAAVTDAKLDNLRLTSTSDGIHVEGGSSRIGISDIFGRTDDDCVAFTPADYPDYRISVGDISNVQVRNVHQNSSSTAVKFGCGYDGAYPSIAGQIVSPTPTNTQYAIVDVAAIGIRGDNRHTNLDGTASTASPIVIWADDFVAPSSYVTPCKADRILVQDVRAAVAAGSLVSIGGSLCGDLALRDLACLNYLGSAGRCVQFVKLATCNAGSAGSLSIDGFRCPVGQDSALVYVGSDCACNDLTLHDVKPVSSTATLNLVLGGGVSGHSITLPRIRLSDIAVDSPPQPVNLVSLNNFCVGTTYVTATNIDEKGSGTGGDRLFTADGGALVVCQSSFVGQTIGAVYRANLTNGASGSIVGLVGDDCDTGSNQWISTGSGWAGSTFRVVGRAVRSDGVNNAQVGSVQGDMFFNTNAAFGTGIGLYGYTGAVWSKLY
jgi:hypothetical protein